MASCEFVGNGGMFVKVRLAPIPANSVAMLLVMTIFESNQDSDNYDVVSRSKFSKIINPWYCNSVSVELGSFSILYLKNLTFGEP
jgi:hypothetical protein